MGKHHNKMPKALVEAQKQQRLATIHESPDETSPNKRKEAKRLERQARIELMSNRNSFYVAEHAITFPARMGTVCMLAWILFWLATTAQRCTTLLRRLFV